MDSKMSKQNLQWQAEDDARTMARYQEIMQDKSRMGRAIKEANKQAQDLNKRANAMRSAASMRPSSATRASRTSNRTSGRRK